MGKTGSWMHSIKKAVHNHLVGDIDPNKFQHLPGPSRGTTPRAQSECSSTSSHTVDAQYRRSSASAGGSSYQEEERRRYSTSSQVQYAESNGKSPRTDKASTRSDISSSTQGDGQSGHHDSAPSSWRRSDRGSGHQSYDNLENGLITEESYNNRDSAEKPMARREKGNGDHSHLVKLYREDRATGGKALNKEEKAGSRTSYDRRNGSGEDWLAASEHDIINQRLTDERRRPSSASQKERSPHEKPPVDQGRLSNAASQHNNERKVLDSKVRLNTFSNHNSGSKTPPAFDNNREPSMPSLPDERAKTLLTETNPKSQLENRSQSTDKGRPKTPAFPRKAAKPSILPGLTPVSNPEKSPQHHAASGPYAQMGRSIALQELLTPTSFERKSSSSSTMSMSQAGGSARSITSEGSNTSEEFVDLVFPLPDAIPTTRASPHHPQYQRKKGAAPIATIHEVFSSHECEAPVSPGSQRRKSGNFNAKNVVPLPELGTKPLLPPNYRSPAAMAVADLGTVMFHAGEAGVGGMLGEWAAIMIQSFWRGYAARKTFKALLALVRLQALARGYLVRKKFRPLVNARIQAARARSKLSRNSKVQLHATSNGYGIAKTTLQNRPHHYTFAQPVLEDSPTPTTRKSKSREPSISEVSDWNNTVTLITLAELKQEVLMKKEKSRQQQQQQ
ncbi:hypothetical protein R1flu_019399 [Riccia fluitans]|uniref:DUF4005 domain-containing protein n=1 Tax=Riccia fluitans TaxID=41844 RepID=A0ABD1ZIJ0_9MARC